MKKRNKIRKYTRRCIFSLIPWKKKENQPDRLGFDYKRRWIKRTVLKDFYLTQYFGPFSVARRCTDEGILAKGFSNQFRFSIFPPIWLSAEGTKRRFWNQNRNRPFERFYWNNAYNMYFIDEDFFSVSGYWKPCCLTVTGEVCGFRFPPVGVRLIVHNAHNTCRYVYGLVRRRRKCTPMDTNLRAHPGRQTCQDFSGIVFFSPFNSVCVAGKNSFFFFFLSNNTCRDIYRTKSGFAPIAFSA